MAYDKVVDSAVLDAGLKQIADAIREKGGTSDNLAFPTAMAEAIAAIEAGGVGIKYATGRITPAEQTTINSKNQLVITHNLGVIPSVLYMSVYESPSVTSGLNFIVTHTMHGQTIGESATLWVTKGVKRGSSSSTNTVLSQGSATLGGPIKNDWNETTAVFVLSGSGGISFVMEAGKNYDWMVFG